MKIKEKAKAIKNGEQGKAQFVRFVLNGIFAATLQYVVYLALMHYMMVDVAYGVSYFVSFLVNFFTTTYFTFRSHATWKKFVGFCGSHGVNYVFSQVLFSLFINVIHMNAYIAPFVVMGVAMILQFAILRFVFKKR